MISNSVQDLLDIKRFDDVIRKSKVLSSYLREVREKLEHDKGEYPESWRIELTDVEKLVEIAELAAEMAEFYDKFEVGFKWEGIISPGTPFSKFVSNESTSSPARNFLEAVAKICGGME